MCATANAYDNGLTEVPATWTTPGPAAATPAKISDVDDEEVNIKSASAAEPTKSSTEEKSAKTSEGAAPGKAAGSWLALLGLGIGMAF